MVVMEVSGCNGDGDEGRGVIEMVMAEWRGSGSNGGGMVLVMTAMVVEYWL